MDNTKEIKVLFVASGRRGDVSVIIKNQGESLRKLGVHVDYFPIKSGIYGYVSSIPRLRKQIQKENYQIIHAHYSLSAFVASCAGRYPLVVSLMGSDLSTSSFQRFFIKLFLRFRWNATIVKNHSYTKILNKPNVYVLPNGVDIDKFKPSPTIEARNLLGLNNQTNLITLISYKNRPEKNTQLAYDSINLLKNEHIEFIHVHDVPNEHIPLYLSSSNLLLLTSLREGSPNVIKEAMACNCPIVSTDVGDVSWIIGDTEGCYISANSPEDIAASIKLALAFNSRTNGRKRIKTLALDSKSTAQKIIHLYEKVLREKIEYQ